MQDQLIESPSALDELVSELNHSGKSQYIGLVFPVPTRLQIDIYGMVEALTHHAGTSRNKMMNQLVEVGIQATLAALPASVVEQLTERAESIVATSVEKNGGLYERGEA